jgi:hypothetical protein
MGAVGYEHAGFFSRLTFAFIVPLLKRGESVDEDTADAFLPSDFSSERLAAEFDAAFQHVQVGSRPNG